MAHKVFICHSTKDKLVADAACASLEAYRIPCWIAPRDIAPSTEWGEAIVDAITECKVVLLIFSQHANESPDVRREVNLAISEQKALLPLRIEKVSPTGAIRYAVSNRHWLEAVDPPMERRLFELREKVARLLDLPSETGPLWVTDSPETVSRTRTPLGAEQEPLKQELRPPAAHLERVAEEAAHQLIADEAELRLFEEKAIHRTAELRGSGVISTSLALRRGTLKRTLKGGPVSSVAFSPDGRTLASGYSHNNTIKLWDLVAGGAARDLRGLQNASRPDLVTSLNFSPDGRTLASGGLAINVWNFATGDVVRVLQGHSSVSSVSFSPDGRTLASGGKHDKSIKLWDVADGRPLKTLQGHASFVNSVAFSPNGDTVASGGSDNDVKLWSPAIGQELLNLRGHSSWVSSLAFSPHGRTLVSGSGDHTLKLWELPTGRELFTLRGHSASVYSAAFSPDGGAIASGSSDKTINLWNAANGQKLFTLRGHTGCVTSIAFSPDGGTLACGSDDGTVTLWDIS